MPLICFKHGILCGTRVYIVTALLEYMDILNRYSWSPLGSFQAGTQGKMPQLPPSVGGPEITPLKYE